MEWVRSWIEQSPYGEALGVRAEEVSEASVRLLLPYRNENSNGDKALHGGVSASMIAIGGQAVCRAALGAASGPWHLAALQVTYLSAALGEAIQTEARILRRGKELAYAEVEVRTDAGKPIAQGLVTVRGRFGAAPGVAPLHSGDSGASDLGPMGGFVHRVPFHGKLGISAEHMTGGHSRLSMPWKDANADASGGVHEGAVLALLDTTGAMAAWAETGPGRFKASTPGIQARVFAPPGRSDLIAFGQVVFRDREILFTEVDIACAEDRRLVARGAVNYRIVTPDLSG